MDDPGIYGANRLHDAPNKLVGFSLPSEARQTGIHAPHPLSRRPGRPVLGRAERQTVFFT